MPTIRCAAPPLKCEDSEEEFIRSCQWVSYLLNPHDESKRMWECTICGRVMHEVWELDDEIETGRRVWKLKFVDAPSAGRRFGGSPK